MLLSSEDMALATAAPGSAAAATLAILSCPRVRKVIRPPGLKALLLLWVMGHPERQSSPSDKRFSLPSSRCFATHLYFTFFFCGTPLASRRERDNRAPLPCYVHIWCTP